MWLVVAVLVTAAVAAEVLSRICAVEAKRSFPAAAPQMLDLAEWQGISRETLDSPDRLCLWEVEWK